jgi:hypothetical protein
LQLRAILAQVFRLEDTLTDAGGLSHVSVELPGSFAGITLTYAFTTPMIWLLGRQLVVSERQGVNTQTAGHLLELLWVDGETGEDSS